MKKYYDRLSVMDPDLADKYSYLVEADETGTRAAAGRVEVLIWEE